LAIAVNLYLDGKLDEKKDLDEQYDAATKLLSEEKYDKGAWSIQTSVINLSFSHLINFRDMRIEVLYWTFCPKSALTS